MDPALSQQCSHSEHSRGVHKPNHTPSGILDQCVPPHGIVCHWYIEMGGAGHSNHRCHFALIASFGAEMTPLCGVEWTVVATNQWFLKYYSEFNWDQGECPPKTGWPLIFVVGVESMSLIHFVLGLIIIAEVKPETISTQ